MRETKAELKKRLTETIERWNKDIDKRNEELRAVYTERNSLRTDKLKLEYRLDACLFSMVLMQKVIRDRNKKDTLSLAE